MNRRVYLSGSALQSRVAQWQQRSLIKSIQYFSINMINDVTDTATITAVDVNHSVLIWDGLETSVQASADIGGTRIALTNATTVTATRVTAAANTYTILGHVVEYWPGVIKRMQRGTIVITGASSNTATITAVNTAKTSVNYLGVSTGDVTLTGAAPLFGRLALTNATTLTLTIVAVALNSTGSYEVVEFY